MGKNNVYLKKKCNGQLVHKWCSASSAIREMQIKTTVHQFTLGKTVYCQVHGKYQAQDDARNWDPCTWLLREWWEHRRNITILQKAKNTLTIGPSHPTVWRQSWKRLSETGCYWSKQQQSQWLTCGSILIFRQWGNQWPRRYTHSGISSGPRKEGNSSTAVMGKTLMTLYEVKYISHKKQTLYTYTWVKRAI